MRPIKERHIDKMPPVTQFKPVGVPLFAVDEMVITVEEMEAIRLADVEELDQEPASVQMGISRSTFHRILAKAHTKIAQALWQGKSLRVDGGTYRVRCCECAGEREFRCGACGYVWTVPKGNGERGCQRLCAVCGAKEAVRNK